MIVDCFCYCCHCCCFVVIFVVGGGFVVVIFNVIVVVVIALSLSSLFDVDIPPLFRDSNLSYLTELKTKSNRNFFYFDFWRPKHALRRRR